jgi:hypothetical protein
VSMETGGSQQEIDRDDHMGIKELGRVIYNHSDSLETSHNKLGICVSFYIVGSCCS